MTDFSSLSELDRIKAVVAYFTFPITREMVLEIATVDFEKLPMDVARQIENFFQSIAVQKSPISLYQFPNHLRSRTLLDLKLAYEAVGKIVSQWMLKALNSAA